MMDGTVVSDMFKAWDREEGVVCWCVGLACIEKFTEQLYLYRN